MMVCCLSCYCQQSHNTLSILQYLYEQIQIQSNPPHIYIRQADVGCWSQTILCPLHWCYVAIINIRGEAVILAWLTAWERQHHRCHHNWGDCLRKCQHWKYFMTSGKIFYGFMNVENVDYIGSNPSLGTKVWFTGCKFLHGCVKSLQEMLFEQDFENLGNICQKFEHHENFPTFWSLSKPHLFVTTLENCVKFLKISCRVIFNFFLQNWDNFMLRYVIY